MSDKFPMAFFRAIIAASKRDDKKPKQIAEAKKILEKGAPKQPFSLKKINRQEKCWAEKWRMRKVNENHLNTTQLGIEQEKMRMRIFEDELKQQNRRRCQLQALQARSLMKEAERELKKAQVEVMAIDADGRVEMVTKNLQIEAVPRKITNFAHPEIVVLKRLKNPEEKIFLFYCELQQEVAWALLLPEKCGGATYIMRKLSGIGAEIFAATSALKKQYAKQLITLLIRNAKMCKGLPDRYGWYTDEDGKIAFFDGKWSWEEAMACTK